MANDSDYGLGGTMSSEAPYGGIKRSGDDMGSRTPTVLVHGGEAWGIGAEYSAGLVAVINLQDARH
jgi:hypothetical protein